ncbi:hypothetical protein HOY82DRAFT_536668 [Tuber indicum]|nr:hypothetical protein HOY82DRAFT_536668 [Tuber indicum]
MFHDSHEGMSGRYVLTYSSSSSSSSSNEKDVPQNPSSFSGPSKAAIDSASTNRRPSAIVCPVSVCSLVFEGESPDGYLWRHLRRPGIHGRTGDEKAIWLQLHKIEHGRLLATRVTPAQRKREAKAMRAQKMLRIAKFEQRARNMRITERAMVAQKVAIWEGMFVAEQNGDSIGVSIIYSLPFGHFNGIFTERK